MQTSEIFTIVYTNAIDGVILDLQTKAVNMKTLFGVKLINFDLIHWFDSLTEAQAYSKSCGFQNKIVEFKR